MAGDGEQATILVVDDTLTSRVTLAKGVEREGHQVLTAPDGRAALDALARDAVDMVLLDLLMPEVNGFDVLAAMSRDPALRDIPVLVISAVDKTEDVARALEMGAIDCLSKPFDPVILRVRLRMALEQARLRRVEQDYLRQELALRQQERLATLGRLSSGLGHELNNPAAAALRSARQLGAALEQADELLSELVARPDAADAAAALATRTGAPPATAAEREDAEIAVEDALARLGVAEPWNLAADLVAAGLTGGDVEAWLSRLPGGHDVALAWWRVRRSITTSVQQITGSIERIAELTAALRGYSYLDRAPQQDVDVRRGLDDTITMLEHKRPEGVEVVREYADDLPVIDAYGGQLNQVWTNLLDNAIDAAGDAGRIVVRAVAHGAGVAVEVEDDGPGIPDELLRRVFDPFVTTKPPGQGTGLGLNISHQIVTDSHGGKLTVRSAPGHTVFRVELPAQPPRRGDSSAE